MINELYCLLNNALAADLQKVVAADYVPAEYRPVRSSETIHQMWLSLVGEGLQARQYWICHIRRLIDRGFKTIQSTRFDARQAYAISDMQSQLADMFAPKSQLTEGWRVNKTNWWADEYTLNRLMIDVNGSQADLYINDGIRAISTSNENASGFFTFKLPNSDDISLMVEKDVVGGGFQIQWATRPRETVNSKMDRIIESNKSAISDLLRVSPSRLDASYRAVLGNLLGSPASGAMRAGSLALLVAAHFAQIMDSR